MAELNDDFIELTSIVKAYTEEAAVAAIAKVKMEKEKHWQKQRKTDEEWV